MRGRDYSIKREHNDYVTLQGDAKIRLSSFSSHGEVSRTAIANYIKEGYNFAHIKVGLACSAHAFGIFEGYVVEELRKRDWSKKKTEWVYVTSMHNRNMLSILKRTFKFRIYDYANAGKMEPYVFSLQYKPNTPKEEIMKRIAKIVDKVYKSAENK